jgi:hypothetical protein
MFKEKKSVHTVDTNEIISLNLREDRKYI